MSNPLLPLKAARSFVDNGHDFFGIYSRVTDRRRNNGELLATCADEETASMIVHNVNVVPELLLAIEEMADFMNALGASKDDEIIDLLTNYGEHIESVGRAAIAKANGLPVSEFEAE